MDDVLYKLVILKLLGEGSSGHICFFKAPGCTDTCCWKLRRCLGTSLGGGTLETAFYHFMKPVPMLRQPSCHSCLLASPLERTGLFRLLFPGKG